jgi:hypothetical protein
LHVILSFEKENCLLKRKTIFLLSFKVKRDFYSKPTGLSKYRVSLSFFAFFAFFVFKKTKKTQKKTRHFT